MSQPQTKYVIKLSNAEGFVEWYESLACRAQASHKADARQFSSKADAEAWAEKLPRMASAFSGIYWDQGKGCYTLKAEVEPA